MRLLYLIIIIGLLSSCELSESKKEQISDKPKNTFIEPQIKSNKNNTQIERQLEDSTFDSTFINIFSTDPNYQLEHIQFPFPSHYLNRDGNTDEEHKKTDSITLDNWKLMDFRFNKAESEREIDAYEQIIESINDSTTKVHYRGIDNGISIWYIFKYRSGWILTEEWDWST